MFYGAGGRLYKSSARGQEAHAPTYIMTKDFYEYEKIDCKEVLNEEIFASWCKEFQPLDHNKFV